MAFKPQGTRVQLAYQNYISPLAVSTVASTNITGFVTGFPLTTIKYNDPWLSMKTNGIGAGAPTIEITFGTSRSVRAVGVMNHTLYDGGYTTLYVDREITGPAWELVGSFAIKQDNADLLGMLVQGGVSATKWRLRLDAAHSDFAIGNVFLGFAAELQTNPLDGGFAQTRSPNIVIEDSAGGARHVIQKSRKDKATLDVTFAGQYPADTEILRSLERGDIVGLIPPEYVDDPDSDSPDYEKIESSPYGQEIFWGYVVGRRHATTGVGGTLDGAYRYATILTLEGI